MAKASKTLISSQDKEAERGEAFTLYQAATSMEQNDKSPCCENDCICVVKET